MNPSPFMQFIIGEGGSLGRTPPTNRTFPISLYVRAPLTLCNIDASRKAEYC